MAKEAPNLDMLKNCPFSCIITEMIIPIRHKGAVYDMYIDKADYSILDGHSVCISPHSNGIKYATVFIGGKHQYVHRIIMKPAKGIWVDHINGNGLDNRQNNLRLCNRSQNGWNSGMLRNNTSGYKGVSWHKSSNRWYACCKINNKSIYIGSFLSARDAAIAYNKKVAELRGEFAWVNGI